VDSSGAGVGSVDIDIANEKGTPQLNGHPPIVVEDVEEIRAGQKDRQTDRADHLPNYLATELLTHLQTPHWLASV
jgi:hypothetical protein